ncbi:hypothetical protein [Listeria booriae]|uniref:Uncharacterized protein n=1 Tax=Listeria booriae TaxID=1552123 RepID=A0A842ES16_9LIST|nr:hypothetical protein [Listeria booriae]MBC2241850.1 hypothetical protein [Listeria booriae]
MKKTARAVEALNILKSEGFTQKEIAAEINVSREMVSRMSTGSRNMQEDVAEASLKSFTNPRYVLSALYAFSDQQSPPAFSGNGIDRHQLSMLSILEHETDEVDHFKKELIIVLSKPPESLTSQELEKVEQLLLEITDTYAMAANTLATLAETYKFSVKELLRKRIPTWKVWNWM